MPSVTLNRIKVCCSCIRRKEWRIKSKARRIFFGVQMVHEREKASSLCQTTADGAILHAKNAEVCIFFCKLLVVRYDCRQRSKLLCCCCTVVSCVILVSYPVISVVLLIDRPLLKVVIGDLGRAKNESSHTTCNACQICPRCQYIKVNEMFASTT